MTPGQVAWATGKIKPVKAAGAIVRFTSSNPTIATIDAAGRIVAKQAGKTTISVKAGNKTRTYTITVS
jgi:alpha-L-fucosidase 2